MEKIKSFIDLVKQMSIVELLEVVKSLESEMGLSAALLSSPSSPASDNNQVAQEKSTYDVVLTEVGANKFKVIKIVNNDEYKIVKGGLKEAKDIVEGELPRILRSDLPKAEAEELKKQLEEAGAKVELK